MEFERITGFADANGGSFESANQAYKAYLRATGNEGSAEDKAKFKRWLEEAKKTGKLEKMLKTGAVTAGSAIGASKNAQNANKEAEAKPAQKSKMKITPMAIGGIVLGVVIIGGLIYYGVKAAKKA